MSVKNKIIPKPELSPNHYVNVFRELKKRNSSLLTLFPNGKNIELINIAAQAPAPSKDYCQLIMTSERVIFRRWKILLKNDSENRYPSETKDTYEEFMHDENIQRDIVRVFGMSTLNYIVNVVENGKIDIICRLPESIMVRIISFLNLENIAKLSQVNRYYREICKSDNVWIELYKKYYSKEITRDLMKLAERDGWRKVFFTNKIKLQLELRRQAKSYEDDEENYNESMFHTPRRSNQNDDKLSKRISKSSSKKSNNDLNRSLADSKLRYSTFLTED